MITERFSLPYCLQLIRCENVGPVTYWQLVRKFGSPKAALDYLSSNAASLKKKITIFPLDQALREIDRHQKSGIHLVSFYDSEFPKALKTMPDCPPILSVCGKLESLSTPQSIAIVGARNASLMGRNFANKLGYDLAERGWMVVSGLARGIDVSAHQGALTKGTVAVLAGGVDVIYPPEHRDLYQKIQETGCIISEMPLTMHPSAMHFPRRNRLISGLSQGVVVVEAALKSGSLITANFALDQGKELFAMPGSPADPRCRGTNDLLRRGAHVIESIQDIMNVLEGRHTLSYEQLLPAEPTNYSLADEENLYNDQEDKIEFSLKERLFQDLSTNPIAIEVLAAQYNCSAGDLLYVILELELSGLVMRYPSGMVSRL
jgi:DNA processing protein